LAHGETDRERFSRCVLVRISV